MAHHNMETTHLDASPPASVTSDNEGGEKPVREQLKKTSIDTENMPPSIAVAAAAAAAAAAAPSSSSSTKEAATDPSEADLHRKRSIEDVERDVSEDENGHLSMGRHGRKRSRDLAENSSEDISAYEVSAAKSDASSEVENRPGTPDGDELRPITSRPERVTSPKGKRNREQFLKDSEEVHTQSLNGAAITSTGAKDVEKATASVSVEDEGRDAKRHREEEIQSAKKAKSSSIIGNKDAVKLSAPSGFANISSSSPFASLAGSNPIQKPGAEVSSFGKLAQSSSSPFGSLGTAPASASPFGAISSGLKPVPPPPAPTPIGASTTKVKSPFASIGSSSVLGGASGFGSVSTTTSPFSSALSGSSGLGAFGSGSGGKPTITGLSTKTAKPFGAPESESEDDYDEEGSVDDDEDGEDEQVPKEEESRRDKRFHEQDLETGEESEQTIFSCRAKVYIFDDGTWRERGVGTMKLNITRVHSDDEDDSPDSDDSNDAEASASSRKARFILRSDGSHRVVLNTPFTKTMTLGGGDAAGERPTGSVLLFHGFLEGQEKPSMLQVKMKAANAIAMWEAADDLRKLL